MYNSLYLHLTTGRLAVRVSSNSALTYICGGYILPSMNDIVEKRLQNTIADLEADLAQHQQKLDETQKVIGEIQEAIVELRELLPDGGDNSHPPPVVAPRPKEYGNGLAPSEESTTMPNGSSESLTRRQLVRLMVPEFHGETFEASDIREKFLEQHLEVEPPNFPQAINNLLQKMAEKGDTIETAGRRSDKPRRPWLYREKKHQEENLLGP